ncbi:MAG: hypothetical protein AB7O59_14780 [Pirellulales bacterium]
MADFPRIAVGTTQRQADGTAVLWALLDVLSSAGIRVQSYRSRACPTSRDGATPITGQPPRHLDTWLMSPATCHSLFWQGCRACDLAMVEGSFDAAHRDAATDGGSLDTLCDWLDLPRLAIVDVRPLGGCCLPQRPRSIDGLLLDGVNDIRDACRLQTILESVWNVPVLGWLGRVDALREQIARLAPGRRPEVDLCKALGRELSAHVKLERICRLATERPLRWKHDGDSLACAAAAFGPPAAAATTLHHPSQSVRVAVACDEAFGGYFPETLELLEARGATLCEFSPLHDDRLPPDVDVVYLGCGHPERFAERLSQNDCLSLSLKSHLCGGRPIYAECGGLAYLCHQIELPGGESWPMVGALPLSAQFDETTAAPAAAEITLSSNTWLGEAPLRFRGYVDPHWTLAPRGAAEAAVAEPGCELDIVCRHRAIGSRMYLDFAAYPALLERFLRPHRPRCTVQVFANHPPITAL